VTAAAGAGRRRAGAVVAALVGHLTADDLPKIAASLTYFLTLSFAPALIVVLAVLGLVGVSPDGVVRLLESVAKVGPQWFVQFVDAALQSVLQVHDSLLVLLVGIVLALWTASSYVNAFLWAAGNVTGVHDGRGFLARLPLRLGLALLLLGFLDVAAAAVVLAGPVAAWLGRLVGLGETAVQAWSVLRFPFLLAVGALWCAILFQAAPAPAPRRRRFRHTLAGAGVAVVVMLAASVGFSFYLSRFAAYERVYGVLGAAVASLVWAWLLNIGLLVGFEVTASLQRSADDSAAGAAGAAGTAAPAAPAAPAPSGRGPGSPR
jgi:membrane protein